MIHTVTLNPAIDYRVSPERFSPGEINACRESGCRPGGKGINVSLLLTSLGVENTALAVAAGFTGQEILRLLEQAGCKTDFLFLPQGHSRINVKIREPDGRETDLNGAGPEIPLEAAERLFQKLSALRPGDGLVLAGSVPPSLPRDIYARALRQTAGKELLTVADTAGESLLAVLPCRPFLIKPNLEELQEVCGVSVGDIPAAVKCARLLQEKGAGNVIVSLGERGALLVRENGRAIFCQSVKGRACSTVGAGDSLVAGFLYGWQLHGTMEEALRWGVAAGAATAFSHGIASAELVKELYRQVENPQGIDAGSGPFSKL